MILQKGDIVLVCHRRLFLEDQPRFFTGTVDHYEDGLARVSGHSWFREPMRHQIRQKSGDRTKVLPLASGTLIFYVLPAETHYDSLEMHSDPSGEIWLTDGDELKLNLAERESERPH